MFEKQYEARLAIWRDFRNSLEENDNPYQAVINFYSTAPMVNIHTDPWDPEMWPNPWELLLENEYDDFCRVLGMCYSLQLTERFKGDNFEIHISTDKENSLTCYLLFVNGIVLNWDDEEPVSVSELPDTLVSQMIYNMPSLQ
jgi:hypothetical protein